MLIHFYSFIHLYSFIALVRTRKGTHIAVQLHKTKINRKTKINQSKKRLYQDMLKHTHIYIRTRTCAHLYIHITCQSKEHHPVGKQKRRTRKIRKRRKTV